MVRATQVPAPILPSRYPSAQSCRKASTTVYRDRPNSLASVRVDGRRIPGARRRVRIASRSPSYNWRWRGMGPPRASSMPVMIAPVERFGIHAP
jgi:hypothetical protein